MAGSRFWPISLFRSAPKGLGGKFSRNYYFKLVWGYRLLALANDSNGTIMPLGCHMIPERAVPFLPFQGEPDLERLSGPGIRAFFNLGETWGLSADQQRGLLGGVSKSTFHRWKRDRDALLNLDQMERVSHLLGIHKNLQILLPTTANTWVHRPNSNLLFGGQAPIDLMVLGGISWLRQVRLFLDAQRGGWA